jgi:hypothetical protein
VNQTSLSQVRLVLRVMWGAFLLSIGAYAAVFVVVTGRGSAVLDPPLATVLRPVFWVLGLAGAWGSVQARRTFTRRLTADVPAPVGGEESGAETVQALDTLRIACIITWAMCEMVAILGFVLGLLSYRAADFFPFALGAAALLYIHRLEAWPLDRIARREGLS